MHRPAGNTCMVQGGAYYNANANAADFHKASLNFHYPQFACMPGRVWKTQQTEWHKDVSTLPQAIFVRAALAKVVCVFQLMYLTPFPFGRSSPSKSSLRVSCKP